MWRASWPQLMFVAGRGLLAIRVQGVVPTRAKGSHSPARPVMFWSQELRENQRDANGAILSIL